MKFLNTSSVAVSLLCAGMLVLACEKETGNNSAPANPANDGGNKAQLRIAHAAPNVRAMYRVADSLNIFANGQKINGPRLTFGGLFPVQGSNYISVDPGLVEIKVSVGGVVNPDSIEIGKISTVLNGGQFYSFILTDSLLTAARDSSKIFVRDSLPVLADGRIGVRFVHALVDTPGLRVDVWSARRNANIWSNLAMGTTTAFSNQPYINLPDTFIVRRAGTQIELTRLNTLTMFNNRVYTLFARGNVRTATGQGARGVNWFAHR